MVVPEPYGFYHNYKWNLSNFDEKKKINPLSQVTIGGDVSKIENKEAGFPKAGDQYNYFGLVFHDQQGDFKYISKQSDAMRFFRDAFQLMSCLHESQSLTNISEEVGNSNKETSC